MSKRSLCSPKTSIFFLTQVHFITLKGKSVTFPWELLRLQGRAFKEAGRAGQAVTGHPPGDGCRGGESGDGV